MKRLRFYALAISLLLFIFSLFFAAKPHPVSQLLVVAAFTGLVLLLLISVVVGLCLLSREKLRALVPATICFAGLLMSLTIAIWLGGAIRSRIFRRNLPRYNEVVRLVENREIRSGSSLSKIELPTQYSDLAKLTLGKTNAEGGATIEFFIGGGFPIKHSGYLYNSSGKMESDPESLRRWPHHSRISDNWFRIAD